MRGQGSAPPCCSARSCLPSDFCLQSFVNDGKQRERRKKKIKKSKGAESRPLRITLLLQVSQSEWRNLLAMQGRANTQTACELSLP